MRRREFITLVGGAAAIWPLAARAQQADRLRRVAILTQLAEADEEGHARIRAFRDGLQKLGWQIGSNLRIDYRWEISSDERARPAVTEVLRLQPDVIFVSGTVALRVTQQATDSIPIVFTTVTDPVGQRMVASLAHPGGNTTGFSALEPTVGGKWLDLLKEIAPGVTHVAFIFNPQQGPYGPAIFSYVQQAAQKRAVQCIAAPVSGPSDVDTVMKTLASVSGGGLIVSADAFTSSHRELFITPANGYKLPTIYLPRIFAVEGGLAAYGPDYIDQFQQAATYVDQILKGEKPGDLPVQEPTKFELVINMKTAKLLDLSVPLIIQMTADEVIE